jgi:hypothetical protein
MKRSLRIGAPAATRSVFLEPARSRSIASAMPRAGAWTLAGRTAPALSQRKTRPARLLAYASWLARTPGAKPAGNRHSSILDWLKTPIPSWGIYEATRRKAARRRHRRGRALITTSVERCPLRSGESPVALLLQSQNRTTELRTRPGSVLIWKALLRLYLLSHLSHHTVTTREGRGLPLLFGAMPANAELTCLTSTSVVSEPSHLLISLSIAFISVAPEARKSFTCIASLLISFRLSPLDQFVE